MLKPGKRPGHPGLAALPSSIDTVEELEQGLDLINQLREAHGVAPMAWSMRLAVQGGNFIENCPEPPTRSGEAGVLENLAWGSPNIKVAIQAWYDQIKSYEFGKGLGFDVKYRGFAQMLWKDLEKVGCAINKECKMPTYICRLGPYGECRFGLRRWEQKEAIDQNTSRSTMRLWCCPAAAAC